MTIPSGVLWPRNEWLLDEGVTFLNHGSFGAVPRTVIAEHRSWQARMECNPTRFLARDLPEALRAAAGRLAAFVGGTGPDVVFIENATAGCNTVLASIRLSPGDEILLTDHAYAAVRKAAEHAAGRAGAFVGEVPVPFPLHDPAEVVAALAARLGPRTRLVILDHVASPTAALFPVRELTRLCHDAGAKVLIDGAHAPGMLTLDIPSIGTDWYVGNCHKWLMAPKGSGFLWAAPGRAAELHPLVISHGYGQGFAAEFDWIGTRDPTAWLCVPAAIEFHQRLGGAALRERNVLLAREAANRLAQCWKTERGTADGLTGSMATVRLPLMRGDATLARAVALRDRLLDEYHIDAAIIPFAGALWARLSAQAYNEPADYQRLADVFRG